MIVPKKRYIQLRENLIINIAEIIFPTKRFKILQG